MKQILAFILFSVLLCWVLFSPVYKHVLVMRHAMLQKEVDYLLEVGARSGYGYIDNQMIEGSRKRLANSGFDPSKAVYRVASTNGRPADDPSHPVIRGDSISLTLTYPYEELWLIDRLIGLSTPTENDRMRADGVRMSEYVPTQR